MFRSSIGVSEPEEASEYEPIVGIAVDGEVVAKVAAKSEVLMSELEEQIAGRMLFKTFDPNDAGTSTTMTVEEIKDFEPEIQQSTRDGDWEEVDLSELE